MAIFEHYLKFLFSHNVLQNVQTINLINQSKIIQLINLLSKKSANNSKTYQTQSLSNIATSALIHSNSDNDIDPLKLQKSHIDNDNDFIIAYKDDFSFTSEDNLHETSTDKSSLDLSGFIDYNQLMTKPVNVAILLNYLLSGSESPKNLYFCMFVEDLLSRDEKKETLARWAYEIYSTFLMNNAVS